jgi:hypothetical protein
LAPDAELPAAGAWSMSVSYDGSDHARIVERSAEVLGLQDHGTVPAGDLVDYRQGAAKSSGGETLQSSSEPPVQFRLAQTADRRLCPAEID